MTDDGLRDFEQEHRADYDGPADPEAGEDWDRRTEAASETDPLTDDFRIGDPVIDLANGRTMIVVETHPQTVAEWSNDNDYDLTENYANERLRTRPNDKVYGCVYAASIQSEPSGPRGGSGPYTFPSSRLARVTIESVEGVRRVYDAVAVDVLRRLLLASDEWVDDVPGKKIVYELSKSIGLPDNMVQEAWELADVETRFGGEDGG